MTGLCEISNHTGSLIPILCTISGRCVSKPSVHHTRPDTQIYNSLLLTIVYSGKLRLFRFLLKYLNLFNNLRRKILRSQLRIIEEECLSVNHYFINLLTICSNLSIRVNLNTRKLFQQLLKHITVCCFKRGGVVFNCVLFNNYRITYSRYDHRVKGIKLLFKLHLSKLNYSVFIKSYLFQIGLIAQVFNF
ncbi:hypothetical protein DSECCO2_530760 [anaerobic digester metagenome]